MDPRTHDASQQSPMMMSNPLVTQVAHVFACMCVCSVCLHERVCLCALDMGTEKANRYSV